MWVEVMPQAELERRRKVLVDVDGRAVVLFWHDGAAYALDNVCIHQQRELSRGVILNGRVVCPGHQWAFELATGFARERGRCQPSYAVKVEDGMVSVDPVPRVVVDGAVARRAE
jgi:nitrite reductase (NADH) small subunit